MNHITSFADSRMWRSLARLKKQAIALGVFDYIHFFDENDLSLEFKDHFKDKLIPGSRGYGYWSWKPVIIENALKKMNENDFLLYIDAGCHLNLQGKKRLIEYFEILKNAENGIVSFQANQPSKNNSCLQYDGRELFDQPNYRWVKGDLLDYFGARDNSKFTNTQAIGAGIILIKKCEAAIKIVEEWKKIVWERFDLLDDTPSVSPNMPGFIEHRHDQAIWTMLCLKHGVKTLSAYEYWYPKVGTKKMEADWGALQDFPIHAKRDRDLGLLSKSGAWLQSIFNRFVKAHSWSMLVSSKKRIT